MSGKTIVARNGRTLLRLKKLIAAAVSLLFMLLLIFLPAPALSGARRGLSLCGETVIPSLFPFLVLSAFIIGSGLADACGRIFEPLTRSVFRLPGCAGTALILGAIGGYPVGADAVARLSLNGSLTKRESERLLCFAINSSPAFIIGAVGAGFLGSTQAGIFLYAAHLAASASIGLLTRTGAKEKQRARPSDNFVRPSGRTQPKGRMTNSGFSGAFVSAVTGSAKSIIIISAFVVLFSALNALMSSTGVTAGIATGASRLFPSPAGDGQFWTHAVAGILEVTNGCAAAAGAGGMPAVLLTAGILGFSGLSVQFQVISIIKGAGLSARFFVLTRFLHMGLSVFFAWALFSIFPSAVPSGRSVMAIAMSGGLVTSFHSAPAVCAMLFICAILLLSLATV